MFSDAWPEWGLDGWGLAVAAARALWLAGLVASAGALLFRAQEPELPPKLRPQLLRLALAGLALAGVAWLVWVTLQAIVLVGPAQAGKPIALLRALLATLFGRAAVAQLALLAAASLTLRLGRWPPALLALAALAAQATHLHAWAMQGGAGWRVAVGVMHLLAVGAWLGGLPPLWLAVRGCGAALAAGILRRFSRRATLFVALIAASAAVQGWDLAGGLPGLLGTAHGWVMLAKLALFAALLAQAARHRWRLTPALAQPDPAPARAALQAGLMREISLGALVIAAAALLSALSPGMHTDPVWPFAWQPSLITLREDAGVWREVVLAGLALLAALALVGLGIARRRLRWPALALAAGIAGLAAPHLSPLLVPAYPTSFVHSPTGFAAGSIAAGAALYPGHCAGCHGALGRGDGPQAAALPVPPADLTAAHLWMHPDGELFWWLSHGIAAPDGAPAMPGFAGALTAEDRWALIDFLRALNAGLTFAATARWTPSLQAPELDAACGARDVTLRDLRGRPVRVVFQPPAGAALPPAPGATTILLPAPQAREAAGGDCIALDPAARAAYALVTDLPEPQLPGAEVLIDAAGWLRAVLPSARADSVASLLAQIAASPLPAMADMPNM